MKNPKVSVIIPVYNAEKYLKHCLYSVLNSTLKDLEIICVDDGSTDNSLKILKEYEEKDKRIKVICQKNQYAGVARNNGLKIARGEYIHFLDADDWIDSKAYREWYAIAKDKDVDVAVCFHSKHDEKTKQIIKNCQKLKDYISVLNFKNNPKYFIFNAVVPWNKLYRREFLLKNHIVFDDLICANDRSFYFKVVTAAEKICIISEYWMHYRINQNSSLVGETRLKNYDVHFKSFEGIWELFKNEDENIRKMILKVSLTDFFNFYKKSIGTTYEKSIKNQLAIYIKNNIDTSLIGNELFGCSWYLDYLEVMNENLPDFVMANIKKTYKDKVYYWNKIKSFNENINNITANPITYENNKSMWLLSKIQGGIKCYKEHGLVFTTKRFKEKLIGFKKRHSKVKDSDYEHIQNLGINDKKRNPLIIVSLTSFPARINYVAKTIESLLKQTCKPDKLILWLAFDEFPGKEKDLPKELLNLKKFGLAIEWCENLRSYKKLIPALTKYPNDIIVTADDDVEYDEKWLEYLWLDYQKYHLHGDYIYCHRITKFFYPDGEWHTISAGKSFYSQPTYLHKLVGIGGVLYPPKSLYKDVLDIEKFTKYAPTNDDIWFWCMAVLNGFKIKFIEKHISCPKVIQGTQDVALTKINDHGEELFWKDFKNIMCLYPDFENELIKDYGLMHAVEKAESIAQKLKDEVYYKKLNFDNLTAELMVWFYKYTKYYLNLDNPKTFNEKIQWLKLYDSTPLKTKLADKYLVREWIAEKIGEEYLVPLLGVWDKFDDIDFNKLPNQFVLKANHGSGWNVIVKDKSKFDVDDARKKFNVWLNKTYAFQFGFEMHYLNIPPKIIAEKYIADLDGDIYDYRFFCFNGNVKYVWVDIGSGTQHHKRNIYDINWNLQNYRVNYPNLEKINKPETFTEMLTYAQKLAKEFSFVRIDFYSVNGKVYFGEMTFTPQSGVGKWEDEKQNVIYGDLIALPEKKIYTQF